MNVPPRRQMLQVHKLSFAYPGQPALAENWSASIVAGVTLLHGDMGSGKSTLLRLLAGSLPSAAALTLAGVRLDDDPDAYRRHVFFCDTATDAFEQITARECTASLREGDARFDHAEWQSIVDAFRLTPHLDKPLYMLSTGSKRKVWVAAALASGRSLVLLDEPTGALDSASIGSLWNALGRAAHRADRAIVVASAERIDRVPLVDSIDLPLPRF